jgi:hypothetical protein
MHAQQLKRDVGRKQLLDVDEGNAPAAKKQSIRRPV